MAKKIIWSKTAKASKRAILLYWNERNKSNQFSQKLNTLIHDAVKSIGEFPTSGKLTSNKQVRIKIVRDYLIFYAIRSDEIIVLLIWDGHRNPQDLPWSY